LDAGTRQLLRYQNPHYLITRIVEAVRNTRRNENQVSAGYLDVFLPHRLPPRRGKEIMYRFSVAVECGVAVTRWYQAYR
jgi:uncharacterized protein (DUF2126 family)